MVVNIRRISHPLQIHRLLGPNTIVRQNTVELFDLPLVFGAVLDAYTDYPGFTIGFNSDMMTVRLNSTVTFDILWKARKASMDDEQGILNLYYGQQVLRFPHVYNETPAVKVRGGAYWDAVWEEMRNVQHTAILSPDREPL